MPGLVEIGGKQFTFDEPAVEQEQEDTGPSMARLLRYGWDSTYVPTQHAISLYEQMSSPYPEFERAKQKVAQEKYLKETYPDIHGTKYADSALSITSGFFKNLVDPLTMPLYAVPLLKTMTSAAVGGATALGISSLRGLAEEGEIDPATAGASIALGVLGGAAAGKLGSMAAKNRERELGELGYAISKRFKELKDRGLAPRLAYEQAAQDFATDITGATRVIDIAKKKVTKLIQDERADKVEQHLLSQGQTPQYAAQAAARVRQRIPSPAHVAARLEGPADPFALPSRVPKTYVGKVMSDYLGVLNDSLAKIWKPLSFKLTRLEQDTLDDIHRYIDKLTPAEKLWKHLPKALRNEISLALYNGDDATVRALASPQLYAELQKIRRDVFDDLGKRIVDAGHKKFTLLDDYWPRHYDDWEGFAEHRKISQRFGTDFQSELLHLYSKAKAGKLNELEFNEALRGLMTKARVHPLSIGKTTNMYERKIDVLKPDDVPFLTDPFQAARIYAHDVVENIHKRKFFGFGNAKGDPQKYQFDLDKSIEGLIQRGVMTKELRIEDAEVVRKLLMARFGAGERVPSKFNQRVKNVFYGATLGDPTSAATQLGDIGTSFAFNGVINTIRSVFGKRVQMEDVGLRRLYEELSSTTKTAKWLDRILRVSGFNMVDRFGKSVYISSSLRRLQSQVKSQRGLASFVAKYREMFTGDELASVIADLRNVSYRQAVRGLNPNTRAVLFAELADVQPITRSQMPVKYLEHPNGRIFYMLRTFVLRQMNTILNKTVGELRNGNPVGVKNAARIGVLLVGTNAGIDTFKRSLKGEDVEMSDAAVASLLRTFAMSQYIASEVLSQSKTGRLRTDVDRALSLLIMPPPVSITREGLNSVFSWMSDDPNMKVARYVPFGRLVHDYLLGAEEEKK